MTDRIRQITGTIKLADGTESQFMITRDAGWQQWGAHADRLGESMGVLEALADAAAEFMATSNDEDDEPDAVIMTDRDGPLVSCEGCRQAFGFPDHPEGWSAAGVLRDRHNADDHADPTLDETGRFPVVSTATVRAYEGR